MLIEFGFPRAAFAYTLAHLTNRQRYLELGLDGGAHFATVSGVVKEAVGVCLAPVRIKLADNCKTYQMSTNQYFTTYHDYHPDLIFIDADHHYEQVKIDFENTMNIMEDNAIILFHDTDPESEFFLAQDRCGDSYKILNDLDNHNFYHVTLPFEEAGLTIASKHRRVLSFT